MLKKLLSIFDIVFFLLLLGNPVLFIGYIVKNLTNPGFYRAGSMSVSAFLGVIASAFIVIEGICLIIYTTIGKAKKKQGYYTVAHSCWSWVKEHYIISTVFGISALIIIFIGGIYSLQNHILYYPVQNIAAEKYLEYKDVCTKVRLEGTEDEEYIGWLHWGKEEDCATVVYFGGNAEASAATMRRYEENQMWKIFENYNFLMVDYPGYGQSDGEPGKESILRMAESVIKYVQGEESLNKKIIIMGFSLGTGAASYAASLCEVDGLVLLAPYDTMLNVYNDKINLFHGPMKLLVRNNFKNIEYVQKINTDTLVIASRDDEVIPFRLSENLVDSFPAKVDFCKVDGVGHNGLLEKEEVKERIVGYLLER